MRTVLAMLMSSTPLAAFAHDGHGESGTHGHGSDLLMPLALLVVVALWLLRRRGG
jgi:MYXO-CTERM domain-containing protein